MLIRCCCVVPVSSLLGNKELWIFRRNFHGTDKEKRIIQQIFTAVTILPFWCLKSNYQKFVRKIQILLLKVHSKVGNITYMMYLYATTANEKAVKPGNWDEVSQRLLLVDWASVLVHWGKNFVRMTPRRKRDSETMLGWFVSHSPTEIPESKPGMVISGRVVGRSM